MAKRDVVVIGASAGGVDALRRLVSGLPADIGARVFVVLHSGTTGPRLLPTILSRSGVLPARYAADGEATRCGVIYVAPPDHHMLIKPGSVQLTRGARENYHRPAIDPMFRSAALAYGPRVIAVVLTGELDDGTAGLSAVKRCGGIAVAQDPADASHASMPASAVRNVAVDHVLSLDGMAGLIAELVAQDAGEAPEEGAALVRAEACMVERQADDESVLDRVGRRSALTCPECHGNLWELQDDVLRFRCHVGHAYSPETLTAVHSRSLEDALWAAIRGFGESAEISARVSEKYEGRGEEQRAELFRARAAAAREHADALRGLIEAMPVAD